MDEGGDDSDCTDDDDDAFTATDENESVYSMKPEYVPSSRMTKKGQLAAAKAKKEKEAHSLKVRSNFQHIYARVRESCKGYV